MCVHPLHCAAPLFKVTCLMSFLAVRDILFCDCHCSSPSQLWFQNVDAQKQCKPGFECVLQGLVHMHCWLFTMCIASIYGEKKCFAQVASTRALKFHSQVRLCGQVAVLVEFAMK